MRERSAADNFSLRALPALLADSERSFADKLAARALPPNFPRATAFGFFSALIFPIMRVATLDVKGEIGRIARTSADNAEFALPPGSLRPPFRPPCDQFGASPLEAHVTPEANAGKGVGGTATGLLPNPTRRDVPALC
jgi:hypothetical protein